MKIQHLAPELLHQIYNILPTISDVINLSLTCHRLHSLLRNAHKLGTLFAAADREFGPIEDIKLLVTYNTSTPAHVKRDPVMSYALLRQMIAIGSVGKKFQELYSSIRWYSDHINRRTLTCNEARRVRKAVYRYWLYSEAFHNRSYPRSRRLHPAAVEDRSQLLRCWSTEALIDIEDIRTVIEDILIIQICPTDGTVQRRVGKDAIINGWFQTAEMFQPLSDRVEHVQKLFHDSRDSRDDAESVRAGPAPSQARLMNMSGWGDEISQYYCVQSLLKLNPGQIVWLHDNVTYKWQVESLVRNLGEDWFWNNGQTFSDTWIRVLHTRGEDVEDVRSKILDCSIGVATNAYSHDTYCEIDASS